MTIYHPPTYIYDYLAEGRRKTVFVRKNAKTLQRVDFASILYLAADGAYTDIFSKDGSRCTIDMCIGSAIELFERNDMLQVHKSFAVPFHAIQSVRGDELFLLDGQSLPIGRVYRTSLRKALVG